MARNKITASTAAYIMRRVVVPLLLLAMLSPAMADEAASGVAKERDFERIQSHMDLGVAGLAGTQVPPALRSSMKTLAIRKIETIQTTPPPPLVEPWWRMLSKRDTWLAALGGLTAAWLLYRCRRWIVRGFTRTLLWFDAKALGVRRMVLVDELDDVPVLTPAAVRQRGWSQDLMVHLLGPPDFAVIDPTGLNPPLILLSRKRVEELESSVEFRAYQEMRALQSREEHMRMTKWNRLHGEFHAGSLSTAEEFR